MNKAKLKSCLWLMLSAALFAADYFSKRWAESFLKGSERRVLIPGVLGLRYAENTGAAFSALSGATVFLSLVSVAVCIAVAVYMVIRSQKWFMQLPLSMILAGGLGNLIDRVTCGFVIDYFELLFVRFAIFNLADIYITVGAAALMLALLFGGEQIGRMDRK